MKKKKLDFRSGLIGNQKLEKFKYDLGTYNIKENKIKEIISGLRDFKKGNIDDYQYKKASNLLKQAGSKYYNVKRNIKNVSVNNNSWIDKMQNNEFLSDKWKQLSKYPIGSHTIQGIINDVKNFLTKNGIDRKHIKWGNELIIAAKNKYNTIKGYEGGHQRKYKDFIKIQDTSWKLDEDGNYPVHEDDGRRFNEWGIPIGRHEEKDFKKSVEIFEKEKQETLDRIKNQINNYKYFDVDDKDYYSGKSKSLGEVTHECTLKILDITIDKIKRDVNKMEKIKKLDWVGIHEYVIKEMIDTLDNNDENE